VCLCERKELRIEDMVPQDLRVNPVISRSDQIRQTWVDQGRLVVLFGRISLVNWTNYGQHGRI
jgi:hypothetical protein